VNGPLVAPDPELMIARERRRVAALEEDQEGRRLRDAYLERLTAYENARRELEAASFELGIRTAEVLRRVG